MHYVNGKNNNHSNYNISRFLCKQIQILQTMTVRETYEWLVKYFFYPAHPLYRTLFLLLCTDYIILQKVTISDARCALFGSASKLQTEFWQTF